MLDYFSTSAQNPLSIKDLYIICEIGVICGKRVPAKVINKIDPQISQISAD